MDRLCEVYIDVAEFTCLDVISHLSEERYEEGRDAFEGYRKLV